MTRKGTRILIYSMFWIIVSLIFLAMIFSFSSQNGSESNKITTKITKKILGRDDSGLKDIYLKLVKQGNTFSGWHSLDGYIWEKAPKQIQVKLRNPYYVGLAVTSRNAGVVSTAVFDNLKIDTTDNTFAQQSWKGADIGKVGTAGDFQIDKEIITIRGSGDNIFQAPYGFQYVYKSISGDFSMIVKLNSFEAAQSWAKTGIVIRQSLEPKSDFIDLVATPAEYAQMEWKNGNEAKAINMNLWETKNKIFRKCIHFISYFTLTLLVYAIFSFFNVCGRKKYIFSIITIIIIASLDEFHQSFIPSRGASALDVLIDTAGSNLALFILWTGSKYKEKFMLRR